MKKLVVITAIVATTMTAAHAGNNNNTSTAGRIDKNCDRLQEAQALRALLGNRAAIAHLCKHSKEMRETLVELGVCVVKRK